MKIQDKVVLVTGASAGIGKALAREFWEQGARVVLSSRRLEKLQEITGEWSRERPEEAARLMALSLDVQNESSCSEAVLRIAEHWGGLDILINNAGHGIYGPVDAIPLEEARKLFETNFFGAARMCRAAFPELIKKPESCVVMISSIAGRRGVPWMNYYGASKAAMNIFSESLRMEWANYGIRVLTVMPGMTKSEFGSNANFFGGIRMPSVMPSGSWHTAERVARETRLAVEKKRRELIVGLRNRITVCGQTLFASWIERLLGRLFGPWDRLGREGERG